MKIKTSVLQAISVAVTLSVTVAACTKKEANPDPQKSNTEQLLTPKADTVPAGYSCPACGMG